MTYESSALASILCESIRMELDTLDPTKGPVICVVTDFPPEVIHAGFLLLGEDNTKVTWCVNDKYPKESRHDNFVVGHTIARNLQSDGTLRLLIGPIASDEVSSTSDLKTLNHDSILAQEPQVWLKWILDVALRRTGSHDQLSDDANEALDAIVRVRRVLKAVRRQDEPLLKWIEFVDRTVHFLERGETPGAATGRALDAFRLFPDPEWASHEPERSAVRRMKANDAAADRVIQGDTDGIGPNKPGDREWLDDILGDPDNGIPSTTYEDWTSRVSATKKRSSRRGLGEKIRETVINSESEEAGEKLTDDLVRLLDQNDESAAKEIFDDTDIWPVLTPTQQRQVRDILQTNQEQGSPHFLVELLRNVLEISSEPANARETIVADLKQLPEGQFYDSHQLLSFRWLYKQVLNRLRQTLGRVSELNLTSLIQSVESALASISQLDDSDQEQDDELSANSTREGQQVQIVLTVKGEIVGEFTWFASEARMDECLEVLAIANTHAENECQAHANTDRHAFWTLLCGHFSELQSHGLPTKSRAEEMAREWSDSLEALVPELKTDRYLALAILGTYSRAGHNGMREVSFLHPERLKWLTSYFDFLADNIEQALNGLFRTNEDDSERYLEWLENLTPVRIPFCTTTALNSLLVTAGDELLFSQFQSGSAATGPTTLSKKMIRRIVKTLTKYLDTFPHKRDGMELVVFELSNTNPLSIQILEHLLKETKDARFRLNVVQSTGHENVRNFFDTSAVITQSNASSSSKQQLHPPVAMRLLHDRSELEYKSDVILAVDHFMDSTQERVVYSRDSDGDHDREFDCFVHESTLLRMDRSAKPVRIFRNGTTEDGLISRVLRLWNGLVVSAWSGWDNDGWPFVQLSTTFPDQVSRFKEHHQHAQWVVSVDRNLGREEFGLIPERPQVLQIIQDLGTSASHTLIVSSDEIGVVRALLKTKLVDTAASAGLDTDTLVDQVYTVAANLVPRQILVASGPSKAHLEIIGTAGGFAVVREIKHAESGWEFWYSFDDLTDWFEDGHRATRTDLLRLWANWDPGKPDGEKKLILHATVIECKNYQSFGESHKKAAVDQARTGLRFIDQALDNKDQRADNLMWRTDLASLLPREFDPDSLSMHEHGDHAPTLEDVRRSIREGDYEYSSSAYVIRTFSGNRIAHPPEIVDGVNFREISLLDVTRLLQKNLRPS